MPDHLIAEKRLLLHAALPHVPFDGWSLATLQRAAADAGLDLSVARRAFPRGPIDLLEFWIAEADREMLEELERRDLAATKVSERIAEAIRIRLAQQFRHRDAVRRALAFQALPQNAASAAKTLYRTIDAIWYACGDQATDFNYYTKRALLAGVYSATLLYWLNDRSEGTTATTAFLQRRLADVMRIQKVRGAVEKAFGRLPNPFRVLRRRAG